MEDDNESLLRTGLQHNDTSSHDNGMSMRNNKEVIPDADGTNVSICTTYQPSQIDEHILDVVSRYKEGLSVEVFSLLHTTGVPPQGGREN